MVVVLVAERTVCDMGQSGMLSDVESRPNSHNSQFTFFLGTHITKFLEDADVPLFVSRRVLSSIKYPRSYTSWALDSGAFTELSTYGRWVTSPGMYAASARWWYDTVRGMKWAAVQDWMCEPFILDKTGKTVEDHQRLTIESYLRLKQLQPLVPWVPVIQGYKPSEYLNHVRQYEEYDINLREFKVVGVGSVCRRQSQDVEEATLIIRELHNIGIKLHAFGFKTTGLERCWKMLVSADSMAWSYAARTERIKLSECIHSGKNCANCLRYALRWREKLLNKLK